MCHRGCTSLGFNGTTPIHDLHVALCIVRPYLSRKYKPAVQAHSAQALRKLPNAMNLPLALSHLDCVWCVFHAACLLFCYWGNVCRISAHPFYTLRTSRVLYCHVQPGTLVHSTARPRGVSAASLHIYSCPCWCEAVSIVCFVGCQLVEKA